MVQWIICIVFGLCTAASGYMAYLLFTVNESAWYIFAAFGLLFALLFVSTLRPRNTLETPQEQESTVFVSHSSRIMLFIYCCIALLAAVFVPMLLRGH